MSEPLANRKTEAHEAAVRFLAHVTQAFGSKKAKWINEGLAARRLRYEVRFGYPDQTVEVWLHDVAAGTSAMIAGTTGAEVETPPETKVRPSDKAAMN